jgi:hypothetical protein
MKQRPEDRDCYYNHALEDLKVGGRYAVDGPPRRVITGGADYPALPSTPLTSRQPGDDFNAERDRIEPENITPMTYGVDVSGAQPSSVPPAEVDLASPQPPDEGGAPSSASPSSSFRRI